MPTTLAAPIVIIDLVLAPVAPEHEVVIAGAANGERDIAGGRANGNGYAESGNPNWSCLALAQHTPCGRHRPTFRIYCLR